MQAAAGQVECRPAPSPHPHATKSATPTLPTTCVTAPAATPATAIAAGSIPITEMPWLAARLRPKKPAPASSMMAGVAEAAAIQPRSAWVGWDGERKKGVRVGWDYRQHAA